MTRVFPRNLAGGDERTVDLHMHTTASDGLTSPEKLLEIVRNANVAAFAVTDHDTLDGSAAMRELMVAGDPELVTATELSAGDEGEDLHLLAYFFATGAPPDGGEFRTALADFGVKRATRGLRMVDALKILGVKIEFSLVKEIAAGSPIGRPHVADALLKSSQVRSYGEAFDRWIGYGRPGYVPKETMSPSEVLRLTHEAHGIVILAHPSLNGAENALPRLVKLGLDGIEVFHPINSASKRRTYTKFAADNELLISGGSDYHGRNDHHGLVGQERVPYELLEHMRHHAEKYQ